MDHGQMMRSICDLAVMDQGWSTQFHGPLMVLARCSLSLMYNDQNEETNIEVWLWPNLKGPLKFTQLSQAWSLNRKNIVPQSRVQSSFLYLPFHIFSVSFHHFLILFLGLTPDYAFRDHSCEAQGAGDLWVPEIKLEFASCRAIVLTLFYFLGPISPSISINLHPHFCDPDMRRDLAGSFVE